VKRAGTSASADTQPTDQLRLIAVSII